MDSLMMTTPQDLFGYDGDDPTPTAGDDDYDTELLCDREVVRLFRARYEPPLFWSITLLGGLGNLAVVWIYLSVRQRLKTMTDVYLLNLAVADLLFLVTLPFWAIDASHGWSFGPGLCKLTSALYKVNLYSSVLLLTCISADRYVAIVQTTKAQNSKWERLRCSKLVCCGVWLLAMLLATPELAFATTPEEDPLTCRMVYYYNAENRTKVLVLALQVTMGFCLPFLIMASCYSIIVIKLLKTRSFHKHKAMRVILAVVMVFVLSQLPYTGVLIVEAAQATNVTQELGCEQKNRFGVAEQVLKSLAYTHACLNPFLYAFVGVRFRRDVLHLLHTHCLPRGMLGNFKPGGKRASVMSDTDTTQALSL